MVIKTETLTSTSHHDIFTYLDYIFSCYLYTVGFYPYLLSYCLFGKNKYQIHSYITFNMDDSNDLYIWKLICCVFLNKREVLSRFFEKSYIFKYFSTCQTRSDAFEFWTLCACLSIFSLYISHLLLSSQQSPIDMWTISYPSPDDGFFIYIYIYIYIYGGIKWFPI